MTSSVKAKVMGTICCFIAPGSRQRNVELGKGLSTLLTPTYCSNTPAPATVVSGFTVLAFSVVMLAFITSIRMIYRIAKQIIIVWASNNSSRCAIAMTNQFLV